MRNYSEFKTEIIEDNRASRAKGYFNALHENGDRAGYSYSQIERAYSPMMQSKVIEFSRKNITKKLKNKLMINQEGVPIYDTSDLPNKYSVRGIFDLITSNKEKHLYEKIKILPFSQKNYMASWSFNTKSTCLYLPTSQLELSRFETNFLEALHIAEKLGGCLVYLSYIVQDINPLYIKEFYMEKEAKKYQNIFLDSLFRWEQKVFLVDLIKNYVLGLFEYILYTQEVENIDLLYTSIIEDYFNLGVLGDIDAYLKSDQLLQLSFLMQGIIWTQEAFGDFLT